MRLTPRLRDELKKPLGRVVKDVDSIPRGKVTITVGDIASEILIKSGFNPKVCVFDGKTARKNVLVGSELQEYGDIEVRVANPAGHLMPEVFKVIRRLLSAKGNGRIFVEGEEDLTALAAIVEAPDGAIVVYGQPNEGMVIVDVDESIKSKARKIIEGMENGD